MKERTFREMKETIIKKAVEGKYQDAWSDLEYLFCSSRLSYFAERVLLKKTVKGIDSLITNAREKGSYEGRLDRIKYALHMEAVKKGLCYKLGKHFFKVELHDTISEVELEAKLEAQKLGSRAILKHQLQIFLFCIHGEAGLDKYYEILQSKEYSYTTSWNYSVEVYKKAYQKFRKLFPKSKHSFRPV